MIVLRSGIYWIAFFIWTVFICLALTPILLAPRRWMVEASRVWHKGNLILLKWLAGLDWEVRGLENVPAGPVIIAAKHQSMWDTVVFHALFDDPTYILKKELIAIPFFGWFLAKHGMVAVDRKAGGAAMKHMLRGAGKALEEGRQIIIFPEGTRTAPNSNAPYHPGVALLYSSVDAPVVPAALNSGMFWRRGAFLKKPGTVTIEFLPVMEQGLDRRQFLDQLRGKIETATRALQDEAIRRFPATALDESVSPG